MSQNTGGGFTRDQVAALRPKNFDLIIVLCGGRSNICWVEGTLRRCNAPGVLNRCTVQCVTRRYDKLDDQVDKLEDYPLLHRICVMMGVVGCYV